MRLSVITIGVLLALAVPASADPGTGGEVEVIVGDCDDGTTIVRAHNTTDVELGYLIRIDGRLVEEGRLAPGASVERTYEVPPGESWFFRIRLGLTGEGEYFSDEGTTDRTDCPTPTTPPPTTRPPTTPPPTVGGGGGGSTTTGPTVGGISGANTSPPALAFTGPEDEAPWLIAATIAFLLAGTLALRLSSSRREPAGVADRTS